MSSVADGRQKWVQSATVCVRYFAAPKCSLHRRAVAAHVGRIVIGFFALRRMGEASAL